VSTYPAAGRRPFRITPLTVAVVLLAAALVTWIVTVERMRGMDAGPGTDLGGLGWYVGIWVTMMAAMMFPSAAPMVFLFHKISTERARRGQPFVPTWVFALTYLAVWTAYGLLAYGLYRLVVQFDFGFLDWDRGGRYVAAGAIIAAGIYELTPLKSVCLRHCRSPLHFLLHGWRDGVAGSVRMGASHGAYCVGCCWGLMIVLFALGVMSLTWMAVVAGLIAAQKVLPKGEYLTRVFAVAFVAFGIWVAASPGTVPGLTLPNSDAAEQARMRMMNMEPEHPMTPATPMDGSGGTQMGQEGKTPSRESPMTPAMPMGESGGGAQPDQGEMSKP
jgi:predicted metal-binding membrane protein